MSSTAKSTLNQHGEKPCQENSSSTLGLVTTGVTATTGLLELAALSTDVGLGAGLRHTRGAAEVLDCLTVALRATEQHCVATSGGDQSKLIECQHLATSLRQGAPL